MRFGYFEDKGQMLGTYGFSGERFTIKNLSLRTFWCPKGKGIKSRLKVKFWEIFVILLLNKRLK